MAGTAAGSGHVSADMAGVAPEAELIIVKFDFDNEKERNSNVLQSQMVSTTSFSNVIFMESPVSSI